MKLGATAMVKLSIIQAFLLLMVCFAGVCALYETCHGIIEAIQDGFCDTPNNDVECGYDGGDCCECTVITSLENFDEDNTFFCLDPDSGCVNPIVEKFPNCTDGDYENIGDGQCDLENNNALCGYDEGDCCECTSIDDSSSSYFDTVSSFSYCVDPNATCYDPNLTLLESSCTDGNIEHIRNGRCDSENNNEGCLYDGGDCCTCTCVDGDVEDCGSNGFSCLDPDVAELEAYICEEWPSNRTSCPSDYQRTWAVGNETQARALAEAVQCAGGVFNVTWQGNVIVNETISIFDGTILSVVGVDQDSIINGDGQSRLFAVVNAHLQLCNITVTNGSSNFGGAIAASRSTLTFDRVNFTSNIASSGGGSMFLSSGSTVSFDGESSFSNNIAFRGGALYVRDGSTASWTANSTFSDNISTSGGGGAVYVRDASNAVWKAPSRFLNNSAYIAGGAVGVVNGSSAVWNATSHFFSNRAEVGGGGGLFVDASSAVWNAPSQFLDNSAQDIGGALFVNTGSRAVWSDTSQFQSNTGGGCGGALYVSGSSVASWAGETVFADNVADSLCGGALYVSDGSSAVWTAPSSFFTNSAGSDGGALCFEESTTAEWTAESMFFANSAQSDGGAIYTADNGTLSWSDKTIFGYNTADNGGAVFVKNGVIAEFGGETNFTTNRALSNGGALGSRALDSELSISPSGSVIVVNDEGSDIAFNGATSFHNNSCGANGGGMALVQSLAVSLNSKDIIFSSNFAGVSGGGVFVSGIGIGTIFANITFARNYAQTGGGVHATGSGTTVTIDGDEQVDNPTTFDGCSFLNNIAYATGGAVDSASGQDSFVRTLFEGNTARVGGALRLAGTASIENCSFHDNISELDGGPAVSNVGYISNMIYGDLRDNIFDCESDMFLDFNESADGLFETICDGCPDDYVGCSFGEGGTPTCTSLSEAGIDYATTEGGTTTLEEITILEGYWRATNISTNVFECFNTDACTGGLTSSLNYCLEGYEGPYCSVCSKNYVRSLSYTCRECSDRMVRITIAIILAVLALVVVAVIVWYLMPAGGVKAGRGTIECVARRVPTQSLKIIVVMWQILTQVRPNHVYSIYMADLVEINLHIDCVSETTTRCLLLLQLLQGSYLIQPFYPNACTVDANESTYQFAEVANVTFPNVYQTFLDRVDVLNFDLSWIVSAGCFFELDFHDRLLGVTITPLVIMGLLGGMYAVAVFRNSGASKTALESTRHKHVSMALLVSFLVYSSVSSVLFQMFSCDDLDDGTNYLRADYRIDCDSPKHKSLKIYAGFMILLYPLGIPVLYTVLLFSIRHELQGQKGREECLKAKATSHLWQPYRAKTFYYEVVECGRRIMLAGVVVFIYPNTAAQIADTLAIAVVFMMLSEVLAPYESQWDTWISRTGHAIVVASMYLALLLKVDVSGEDDSSQKTFEVTMVVAHASLIIVVLVEAVIMTLSLRAEQHQEDPLPRCKKREDPRTTLQRSSNIRWDTKASIAQDYNDSDDDVFPVQKGY